MSISFKRISTSEDPTKRTLTDERSRQLCELNSTFASYCRGADPLSSWKTFVQEWEQYSHDVSSRFDVDAFDARRSVWTFGSGDCGQLGHGVSDPPVEEDETSVAKPKRVQALAQAKAVRVLAAGGMSNAVVDCAGVWTWGCADDGALGREGNENLPALLALPSSAIVVLNVALGDCHGALLSMSGHVYAWGSYRDKDGKSWFPTSAVTGAGGKITGPGTVGKFPQEFGNLRNIIAIDSGASHTVAVAADGTVYSWGFGEQGQLGRPVSTSLKITKPGEDEPDYDVEMIQRDHLTPARIPLDVSVRSVGCGAYHTMVISSTGFKVYACGLNQYRQACPVEENAILKMTHVSSLDDRGVSSMHGGEHYSVARCLDGSIYTWGRSDQAQLGRRQVEDKAGGFDLVPTKVQGLPAIAQIGCGSAHVLALTKDGEVFSWGFGTMLQLGHGSDNDEGLPRKISALVGKKCIHVCAGGQHSSVLVQE